MIEATQDRQRGDSAAAALAWICWCLRCSGKRVLDALMRPGVIDIVPVLSEHSAKLALGQDQEMTTALPPDTAQDAITNGRGPESRDWRSQDLTPARRRATSTLCAVRAIGVTNQIARSSPQGIATRSWCAIPSSVGCQVTPTSTAARRSRDLSVVLFPEWTEDGRTGEGVHST